jgi:hypothetical protein
MSNDSSLNIHTETLVDFPLSLPTVLAAITKLQINQLRADMVGKAKKSLAAINSCT